MVRTKIEVPFRWWCICWRTSLLWLTKNTWRADKLRATEPDVTFDLSWWSWWIFNLDTRHIQLVKYLKTLDIWYHMSYKKRWWALWADFAWTPIDLRLLSLWRKYCAFLAWTANWKIHFQKATQNSTVILASNVKNADLMVLTPASGHEKYELCRYVLEIRLLNFWTWPAWTDVCCNCDVKVNKIIPRKTREASNSCENQLNHLAHSYFGRKRFIYQCDSVRHYSWLTRWWPFQLKIGPFKTIIVLIWSWHCSSTIILSMIVCCGNFHYRFPIDCDQSFIWNLIYFTWSEMDARAYSV